MAHFNFPPSNKLTDHGGGGDHGKFGGGAAQTAVFRRSLFFTLRLQWCQAHFLTPGTPTPLIKCMRLLSLSLSLLDLFVRE